MQIRQQMDLDQHHENAHHPMKPNQNLKPKRSNRVFGQDLTNQHRPFSNQINTCHSKLKDGFNFVKKPIILEEKPSVECDAMAPVPVPVPAPAVSEMDMDVMDVIDDDTQKLGPWDVADVGNDLFVTDYVNDIIASLRSDEASHRGVIENEMDFMTFQEDVNARMRVVLVDWLIEVHRKFKLLPSTYFLGINLLDRYLAKKQLHRRKLQLCGCTCLWIASKYHEIFAPEMDDFVYISDNAFDSEALMKMEIDILKTLSFTLTVPTVLNYAERYSKISSHYLRKAREIKIISDLIMYCVEHSVMTYGLCRKVPSLIGAACFVYSCLSTKVFSFDTFKRDGIDDAIGYQFDELVPIMLQIDDIVRHAKRGKHKAVYKKYCNAKYSNIGKLNFDKLNTSFLQNTTQPQIHK